MNKQPVGHLLWVREGIINVRCGRKKIPCELAYNENNPWCTSRRRMISVSNSWANLANFYENILLIFRLSSIKPKLSKKKKWMTYMVIFKYRVEVGTSGDRKYIEILNNQTTHTPLARHSCCAMYIHTCYGFSLKLLPFSTKKHVWY